MTLKTFARCPLFPLLLLLTSCTHSHPQAAIPEPAVITLNWLDLTAPLTTQGVSLGVPWPQGKIAPGTPLTISTLEGKSLPTQTWPLAYWPDGSLKWTAHAIVAAPELTGPLKIDVAAPSAPIAPVTITSTAAAVTITTGALTVKLPKQGPSLIESISLGGNIIATRGILICSLEDRSDYANQKTIREEDFTSQIEKVTVEQSGPVRAVVKIEGKHKSDSSGRAWLPFIVRLYFYAGVPSIRMVHTFVFDGDQEKDFIRSLGVRFSVPMREQFQNRHVRFAGETGMFSEPIQLVAGRRPMPGLYEKQIAGQRIPNLDHLPGAKRVRDMAVWDSYRLTQITDTSYVIQKRTNDKSAWINASSAGRSLGLAFAGDVSGGLAVGIKNFWQLAPTELEINNQSTDAATLTAWLWSPESPAMDLRHYDTKAHGLEASYEDVQPGFSTATGIARTSELTIQPFNQTPTNDDLLKAARAGAQPPVLICTPKYYHSVGVFGLWSLPDRSTPGKKWIENELDKAFAFYQHEVEQRHWYGFWDFGDVMHTYDAPRHEWRDDTGGLAWDNTELVPNLWLWYAFLRSGRADIYRMAENMTRQTQEVDVYHLGPFAGLGSRHNVRHWGDGAKELRISQAMLKRMYYYLSTDERVGDLLDEVTDSDQKLLDVDPMREIVKKDKYPAHIRVGPDWFAAVSNWYTAWERTGDTQYRDRIVAGMKCIAAMPHKIFSGGSFGYDPKTRTMYPLTNKADVPALAALFGGPELNFEIVPILNVPDWTTAWMQYCQLLNAPRDEQEKALGNAVNTGRGEDFARMAAYAAYIKKDPAFAARAWQQFLHAGNSGGRGGKEIQDPFAFKTVNPSDAPAPLTEIPSASTNAISQWCLNAIELLEMVGNDLPANDSHWNSRPSKSP